MEPPPPSRGSPSGMQDGSVTVEGNGKAGTVTYREGGDSIPMSWEFGGGDILAILTFANESAWRAKYPWAANRQADIVRRVADELIRQQAPTARGEINLRAGWVRLHQSSKTPVPPHDQHTAFRARRAKLMTIIAAILLVLAAGAVAFKMLFSVRSSTGTPLGLSVRAPDHIATLIQALEPYVPSLHRNPANDRYRLALLLTPDDGHSSGKMIPIAQQRRIEEFGLVKLLGCDGTTVWFTLNAIQGVNLETGQLIGEAELRRANPSLNETWDDQRRMEFDQRLRVTTADRKRVYEVTPGTLQAVPASPRAATYPFESKPLQFLSAGVRPSPTEWLGVLSTKAATGAFKPKARLSRLNPADDVKEQRSLYRSQLGPELDRGSREILSQERVSTEEFFNAAFIRTNPAAEPLRLSEPDSFLMVFTSQPGLGGTLVVARVDGTGKILWRTDTGLDRFLLYQILPDPRFIAFRGTRLPVPNKVSEPILVIIDTQSGTSSTVSLWQ